MKNEQESDAGTVTIAVARFARKTSRNAIRRQTRQTRLPNTLRNTTQPSKHKVRYQALRLSGYHAIRIQGYR